jgi:hypothetical protein
LQSTQGRFETPAVSASARAAYSEFTLPQDTAMDASPVLTRLTPAQHSALYARARREAVALRREAMRDAASWLASHSHRLWHRVLHAGTAQQHAPKASTCSG